MPEAYEPGFDKSGSQSVPAGASINNGSEKVLVDYHVPSGKLALVTDFYTYAALATSFGTPGLMFSIYVDGAPHPDYFRIRDQVGSQSQPRKMKRGLVRARTRLQIIAENDSGTAATAGAGAMGDLENK